MIRSAEIPNSFIINTVTHPQFVQRTESLYPRSIAANRSRPLKSHIWYWAWEKIHHADIERDSGARGLSLPNEPWTRDKSSRFRSCKRIDLSSYMTAVFFVPSNPCLSSRRNRKDALHEPVDSNAPYQKGDGKYNSLQFESSSPYNKAWPFSTPLNFDHYFFPSPTTTANAAGEVICT